MDLFLREVAHAEAGANIHGLVGDIVALKHDLTAIGPNEADDHVEGGGLPCAIRAEEADDFAGADFDIDAVHDGASVIDFSQSTRVKEAGAGGWSWGRCGGFTIPHAGRLRGRRG